MKKHFFIFITATLIGLPVFAQRHTNSAEIGIFLGGSYYIGDLNPIKHFEFTKPAAGVAFRYNFNPRLSARANVLFGGMQGDDSYSTFRGQEQRNLNFKSPLTEGSAQLEFNFLDYQIGNEKRKFSPYIFFGLAVFHFKPQGELNGDWINLQPLATEGQGLAGGASKRKYKLTQLSIPFGVGIKTNLSQNIGLSIEWGIRKTFTDYLDDVSKRYYDPVALAAAHGATSAVMSDKSIGTDPNYTNTGRQRGNATTKDWYVFTGIILSLKLQPAVPPCPGVGN